MIEEHAHVKYRRQGGDGLTAVLPALYIVVIAKGKIAGVDLGLVSPGTVILGAVALIGRLYKMVLNRPGGKQAHNQVRLLAK